MRAPPPSSARYGVNPSFSWPPMPELRYFLNASPVLRDLLTRAAQLREADRLFRVVAPQTLTRHCNAASLERGTLVIDCTNGAVAAKLKQQQQRLLIHLTNRGLEIHALRFRVRPARQIQPSRAKGATPGPRAMAALQDLARHLEDSPLKTAVKAMARKCTGADKSNQ